MDAGKIFVIVLTVFALGVLVYLELKARRARHGDRTAPNREH
jgi:hypothetical protein